MGVAEQIAGDVDQVLSNEWDIRDGTVVPKTEDVALSGGAVKLDAAILYSDLADSTVLAMEYDKRVAAKVFKSFLAGASRIIRLWGGDIRSFDGDRVMGIFLGTSKNSDAACATVMLTRQKSPTMRRACAKRFTKLVLCSEATTYAC